MAISHFAISDRLSLWAYFEWYIPKKNPVPQEKISEIKIKKRRYRRRRRRSAFKTKVV